MVKLRKFSLYFVCVFIFTLAHAQEKTISIVSARTTEYIGENDNSNEIIRFSGNVKIIVKDSTTESSINAEEIIFDKTRDTLEARGTVIYERKTGASGSQKFSGEALLFNIKKQEGVFFSGTVTQDSGKKSGDPYIVRAEISGRDSGTTMAFKNGVLSTCDDENPHWSLKASRIWLLPGNEIALFNGFFFVGSLPIAYFPVFYYPSDEMIVHPVFGYRNREGYFVQTTTYVLGRKPLATGDSGGGRTFADFLQSDSLKEQERNGLFLRNLETDSKKTREDYIKIMADGYSTIGAMLGIEGSVKPKEGYIKSSSITLMTGFSRTVYPPKDGLFWSTYDSSGYVKNNSGWLSGIKLPFRYKGSFDVNMDRDPFQVTVKIPMMSDPWFKKDFTDRSEDLNWFKYLMDQQELAKGSTLAEELQYSWNINGAINPKFEILNPYITRIHISTISGLLTFNSKDNVSITGLEKMHSPERKFFYPEMIKPELQLKLAGTILSNKTSNTNKTNEKRTTIKDSFNPFDENKEKDISTEKDEENTNEISESNLPLFFPKAQENLIPKVVLPEHTYSISWSLDPSILQEIRYDSTEWKTPKDVNWNTYASQYYQIRTNARIFGEYNYNSGFFTISPAVAYIGVRQDHPWLSKDVYDTDAKRDTILLSDYKASIYSINSSANVNLTPFSRSVLFKPNVLSWNIDSKLYATEFIGTVDQPEWETKKFKWDKDYIKTHSAKATFGVSLASYIQKVALESNLPPLLESYKGLADFTWSFITLSANTRLFEKENDEKKWFWDPFITSANWNFPLDINLSQSFEYDIEEDNPTRLHLTAARKSFSAFYTYGYTIPNTLDPAVGWAPKGTDKKFIPTTMGASFNNASSPLKLYAWKNRFFINTALNSKINFDLLKLTESSFDFTPSLTFKIHEFLDITFSSTSRNDVIARYFQDWIDLPAPLPGNTNIWEDIIYSFNFSDEKKRTSSGFKLKNLSLDITHYLHDWTATFKTTVNPELKTDGPKKRYEFIPVITFMVQWKPITDIKTTIKSEKGEFTLNTTSSDSSSVKP